MSEGRDGGRGMEGKGFRAVGRWGRSPIFYTDVGTLNLFTRV